MCKKRTRLGVGRNGHAALKNQIRFRNFYRFIRQL